MKFTKRLNGKMMVTIKIEAQLDLETLACVFTAIHENDAAELAKTVKQRELVSDVRDYILTHGVDAASYRVGDYNLEDVYKQVEQIFETRFVKGGA